MGYPTDPKSLGEHLRKRRGELQQTQKTVALLLNISPWTFLTWETGQAKPSISMMPRIINYLGYDPYPPPKTIGEHIAAGRRQSGISRKHLARIIGVDEKTVARWERGRSIPAVEVLERLNERVGLIVEPADESWPDC